MKEKTRQHYVPKFYLKNFTKNNLFNLYDIKEKRVIKNVNYQTQCFIKNFYGKDNIVENELSKKECIWSAIVRKINENKVIDSNDINNIKEFVLYQYVRTQDFNIEMQKLERPVMTKYLYNNGFFSSLSHKIFWYIYAIKNDLFDNDIFDEIINICIINKYNLLNFWKNRKILIKKYNTNNNLISSDSPVIFYNQKNNSEIGMSAKHQIAFLPIDNSRCIFIYNPDFYNKYINNIYADSNDEQEVQCINRFVYIKAFNSIYGIDENINKYEDKYQNERKEYIEQNNIIHNNNRTTVNIRYIKNNFCFDL